MAGPTDSTEGASRSTLMEYLLSDIAALKRWRERTEDRLLALERAQSMTSLSRPKSLPVWLIELVKTGVKAAIPYLSPYLTPFFISIAAGIGTAFVTGWKAVSRGWFGF